MGSDSCSCLVSQALCVGQCCRMCSGVWCPIASHVWHIKALDVGQCCWVCSGVWFGVLFLAMSGISQHCVLGSVVRCAQGFGLGSCSWPCLASHSTVCWAVLYDVLRGLGSCSWPCLASQSAAFCAVSKYVFRDLRSCSWPSSVWHLTALCVGQCCRMCSGPAGFRFQVLTSQSTLTIDVAWPEFVRCVHGSDSWPCLSHISQSTVCWAVSLAMCSGIDR